MQNEFTNKLKESCSAILPMILVIVLINYAILVPEGTSFDTVTAGNRILFGPSMASLLLSALPLILGTTLFSVGVEKSIAKIGEIVGTTLTRRKSITMLLVVAGLMGFLATLAEPDLSVLASRVSKDGIYHWLLIIVAGIGVGVFMVLSVLRVVFNKPLKYWLSMGYLLIFTLFCFADKNLFATLCFDAGGMTTGVVTVPFILSLGMGVAQVLGGDNAEDDSFGYSGLCSMGTVLACTIFFLLIQKTALSDIEDNLSSMFRMGTSTTDSMLVPLSTYSEMGATYLRNFVSSLKDVALSMTPIVLFFVVFNLFAGMKGKALGSVVIGFVYTFLGLVLFFLGAESGFMPVATSIGKFFAAAGPSKEWLFFLVGGLTGFISMLAEPSVRILAENVSEVSRGVISKRVIFLALCLATSLAIVLNIVRIQTNFPALYLYVILFLVAIALSFLTPDIYVGIAIDAAGVATGTMAGCFFLPMFIGFTSSLYENQFGPYENFGEAIMENGFGVVGTMSILPIILMELVGIAVVLKTKLSYRKALRRSYEPDDSQVIHLPMEA